MFISRLSRFLGVSSIAASKFHGRDKCSQLPLVNQQQQLCISNPNSILCISSGARRGIFECQYQFRYERWNCTTTSNTSVFGPVLSKGKLNKTDMWNHMLIFYPFLVFGVLVSAPTLPHLAYVKTTTLKKPPIKICYSAIGNRTESNFHTFLRNSLNIFMFLHKILFNGPRFKCS